MVKKGSLRKETKKMDFYEQNNIKQDFKKHMIKGKNTIIELFPRKVQKTKQ